MENWKQSAEIAIQEYTQAQPSNQNAIELAAWLIVQEKLGMAHVGHNDLLRCLDSFTPKSNLEATLQQQIMSALDYVDESGLCQTDPNNGHDIKCKNALNRYLQSTVTVFKTIAKTADAQGKENIKQALTAMQATLN